MSLAIGGTLTASTASAQTCALNYNGNTGVTTYGPCQAAGNPYYVPAPPVTALNGPTSPAMGGCPINYNGDIGAVTQWGPCEAMGVSPPATLPNPNVYQNLYAPPPVVYVPVPIPDYGFAPLPQQMPVYGYDYGTPNPDVNYPFSDETYCFPC